MLDTAAGSSCGLENPQRFGGCIDRIRSAEIGMGQKNLKASDVSAGIAKAPEGDTSTIFLNDSLADPQSEPGALRRLGSEERLEEVPGVLGIDADAGVAHRNPGAGLAIAAAAGGEDVQPERASIRHSLHGVADEVEEDLLQLHGKALDHALALVAFLDDDLVEFHPA